MSKIDRRGSFKASKRIVVKIGSALLAQSQEGILRDRIAAYCAQICQLVSDGYKIVVVTSGAVAAGMGRLGLQKRPSKINELQAKAAIGFGRDRREGEDTAAIERTFTPEFRNRLDATISFGPLPKKVILQVVEKFVLQLEVQLMDRNVSIELSKAAAEWLANKGYDDKMGARPLARVIQEHIKKPLAEELLFGKLSKGGIVKVGIKDDKIDLELKPPQKARITKTKPRLLPAN